MGKGTGAPSGAAATFPPPSSSSIPSPPPPPPSPPEPREKKTAERLLVGTGFLLCFVLGVHFGGGAYLRSRGYGSGGRIVDGSNPGAAEVAYSDAIQAFVNRRILPAMNETYTTILEQTVGVGTETALRPGERFLKERGAAADDGGGGKKAVGPKHPVLFVPGFVTGGLQLWSGEECLKKRFRESIWGGNGMATSFLADKECWIRHVALDPLSGMDPAGEEIKIRAQQGFEAADYFISGFWILGKLIQSLADVGYDPNSMDMMTYDWRMAFPLVEERDGFLTDFKLKVERMVEKNGGEKAVLLGHSMGNVLVLFFFRWVTEPEEHGGGGGGDDWVERHVASFVNVGGPLLGVPKAASAILSGEMAETAVLGRLGELLESYLGAKKRKDLIATWASVWSMLPKGGPAFWEVGADLTAVDGEEPLRLLEPSSPSFSAQQTDGADECPDGGDVCANPDDAGSTPASSTSQEVDAIIQEFAAKHETATLDDVLQFMLDWGGGLGPKVAASRYHSFRSDGPKPARGHTSPTLAQWHNPVATPLPNAPSMKIYCLYGVGVDTERGYVYKANTAGNSTTAFLDPPFLIDSTYSDPARNVNNGVLTADGDGSVPLLSLGYMCADGWIDNGRLNPSKVDVITREYKHETAFSVSDPLRAGPKAGEHCDILGNEELTLDVLKIVTGEGGGVDTRVVSNIKEIAERVNSHPLGGLDYISKVEPRHKPGPVPMDKNAAVLA